MAPPQNKENSTANSKRRRLRLGVKKNAASCSAQRDAPQEPHALPSQQGPHAPTLEHSPADGRADEQWPSDRTFPARDVSYSPLPAWSGLIDLRSSRDARPACTPPAGVHGCPQLCPHVPNLTTLSTTRVVPSDALIRASELPVPTGLLELIEVDQGLLEVTVSHAAAEHLLPSCAAAVSLPQRQNEVLAEPPAPARSIAAVLVHKPPRATSPTAAPEVQGASSELPVAQAFTMHQLDPTSPTLLEVTPAAARPASGPACSQQLDTAVPPDARASSPAVQLQLHSHTRRRPTSLAAHRSTVSTSSQPFPDAVSQRPPASATPAVTPAFPQAVAQAGAPAHDVVHAESWPEAQGLDTRHALGKVGQACTERRPSPTPPFSPHVQEPLRQLPGAAAAAALACASAACAGGMGAPFRTWHDATHEQTLSELVAASAPCAESAWQDAGEHRETLAPSWPEQHHRDGDGQRTMHQALHCTSVQLIQPLPLQPPQQSQPSRSSLPAVPRQEPMKQPLRWQPSPAQQQQQQPRQPTHRSHALPQKSRQLPQHLHTEYSAKGPPPELYTALREQQLQPTPKHPGPPQLPAQQCLGPRTWMHSDDYETTLQPPHGRAGRCGAFPVLSNHPVPSLNPPFLPQQRIQSTPQQQERQWQPFSPPTNQEGRQYSIGSHQPWHPPLHPPEQQPFHTASSTYQAPNAGVRPTDQLHSDSYSGHTCPPAPVLCMQSRQQQPEVHQWSPPVAQGARLTSQVARSCANTPIRPPQVHQPSPWQSPHGTSMPSPHPSCPTAPQAQYTPLPQPRQAWPPIAALRPPVLAAPQQPPIQATSLPSPRSRCAMCDTSFAVQDSHGAERLCPDCLACVF